MLELVDLSLEVLASVFISLKADSTTRGNSWLAPRFGFVCDNIANFEVGLPNIVQRFIPPGPSGSKSRALSSKNWTICWHTAKKAEVDSLRRIDAGDGLPGHEVIEFPISQGWSAIAARCKRQREMWAYNKTHERDLAG